MNSADRNKLQANYEKLVNDAKYYQVSGYLISKFVIDFRMDADIKSGKTEQEQMEKLLGILITRGKDSLEHLVAALKATSPWLADALMQDTTASDNNNSTQDPNGNGQLPETCDTSIADYINEVRRSLEKSPAVCRNWKVVAYTMRLRDATVLDIEENNRHCTSNVLYDVLRNWVDEGGRAATFCKLIDILKCEKMMFAADEVEELWTKLCSSSCKLS